VPIPCSQFVRRAAALLPMLVMLVMALATPAAAQKTKTPSSTASYSDGSLLNVGVNITYGVSVTPDNQSQIVSPGATLTFRVTNTGTVSDNYSITANCTPQCSVSPLTLSSVAPGASMGRNVTVSLGTYFGTVTVRATGSGGFDTGSIIPSGPTYTVGVGPDGTPDFWYEAGQAGTANFTVSNSGNSAATYSLSGSCDAVATGCSAPPGSVTVSPSSSAAVPISFTAGAAGTSGYARLNASGPSSDGGTVHVLVYSHTVTVAAPAAVSVDPGSYAASFSVTNTGNVATTYNLASTCGGQITGCSASLGQITVAAGGTSPPVSVPYTAVNRGDAGTVTLTASYAGNGAVNASAAMSVTVKHSYAVAVTPDNQAQIVSPSSSVTFYVQNLGSITTSFNLAVNCSCGISPSTTISVPNGVTNGVNVTVSLNGYTGTVVLTASDPTHGTSDTGSIIVTAPTYTVSASPDTNPQTVAQPIDANKPGSQTFNIYNMGNSPATYAISVSCPPNFFSNCNSATSLQVPSGVTLPLTVSFTAAPPGGVGTMTLTASAQNTSDVATARWQVNTHYVSVAKGGSATVYAGPGLTQLIGVTNNGNVLNSYTLTATCSGAVSTCSAPTSVSNVGIGATAQVTVTYTGADAGGTGTIQLVARNTIDTGIADSGTVSVIVKPKYTVAVTPDGGTAQADAVIPASVPFVVTNNGTAASGHYTLGVTTCGGTAVRGSCTLDSTSVTINRFQSTQVKVSFLAGVPKDTAAIRILATSADDSVFHDTGNTRLTVTTYAVSVTPDSLPVAPAAYASYTQSFVVTNKGSTQRTFNLQVACAPPAVTACSSATTALTLAPLDSASVNVSYTAGDRAATGTLRLIAADNGGHSTDGGTLAVTVGTSVANNQVQFKQINPGTTIERSACLVFSIVRDVADECGALRIVHPLPALTTLGKARVPTLIYSSDQLQGPTLAVNVILADTTTPPQSVQLTVTRTWSDGHVNAVTQTYPGTDWQANNRRRRIAVPNVASGGIGILRYSVSVSLVYPGGVTKLAAPVDSSELAFVDRTNSPFGAGWWLAGLEQLFTGQYDGSVLWVAGDGSTRKYVNQHTTVVGAPSDTVYLAAAFDRPDTLLHRADSTYQRRAGNGLYIVFDGYGLHKRTVNRLGHETHFNYDGNSHLSTIQLPPWQNGTPALTYTFAFNPTFQLLDSVTAPALNCPGVNCKVRNVTLTRFGATHGVQKFTEHLGDSIYHVDFEFPSGGALRYAARLDRRVVRTSFAYEDSSSTIRSFATATGTGTDTVRHTFRTAGGIGAAGGSTSLDSVYFHYDGPRPDSVGDTTNFWLDRFGAPTRIVNALGMERRIARGDPRFPGLATETHGPAPRNFTTWANYDARGNLLTSTEVNPRDDGKDATISYAWDGKWDEVTRVTLPAGEVTTFGIDPATGNRSYQQDGRGAMSQVTYYYGADLQLATIQLPSGSCSVSIRTGCQGIDYDALGNVQRVVNERDAWTSYQRDAIGRVTVISRGQGTDTHIQENIFLDATGRDTLRTTTVPQNPDKLVTDASAPKQYLYVKHNYYADGADSAVARWASPDADTIGTMVTQYVRDALGRVIREIAPDGKIDATWFGPSGLVDSTKTRRGYVTHNTYDALGRLRFRLADPVTYPMRNWGVAAAGGGGAPRPKDISAPFPRYRDSVVPGIHDTLVYDAVGNLSEANNPDARVLREYYSDGQLRQETLRIRTIAAGPVDDRHKYIVSHLYDIEGRDSVLNHPTQFVAPLGASDGTTRYTYDPTIGTLQSIIDPLRQQVSFSFNARGELNQVTRPGAVSEGRYYWPDGALANQIVVKGVSQYFRTATFDYDWQGSLIKRADGVRGEFFGARYSGLGHLLSFADTTTLPGHSDVVTSSDSVDAYGNAYKSGGLQSQNNTYVGSNNYELSRGGSGAAVRKYQAGTGRLVRTATQQTGTDTLHYDPSGNVEFLGQVGDTLPWNGAYQQRESRHSYYDAANKLRFADYRTMNPNLALGIYRTALEEYRYDALGRRVLVWSRLACSNQTVTVGQPVFSGSGGTITTDVSSICRTSFARRIVWDGNQELWEMQAPSDTTGGPLVENDTIPITTGLDTTGASAYADPYTQYGLTAYTFGLELDRPVSVIRANWVGTYGPDGAKHTPKGTPPMAFYPHYLDNGQPYTAAFDDGLISRCDSTSDGQRCLTPSLNFRADFLPWAQGSYVESVWLGSLLSDKQDKTGTFYRRNRVYDPLTRQFTQEDPIGLAGGLNVYGFASGDPVTFTDPFGLMSCPPDCGFEGDPKNLLREADRLQASSTSDRLGLAALGIGAGLGGFAIMAGTSSAVIASAGPMLPAVPHAISGLETLADKFGVPASQIANQAITSGTRMVDNLARNAGNVNAIIPRLDGASGWIRVTLDPSQSRIISAGLQTARQVSNGLLSGRFTLLNPK
jgi:RHS repeat-associated protein